MEKTKLCGQCKQLKAHDDFALNAKSKDGLQHWCRKCNSEHAASRRMKNKPALLLKDAAYRKAHREEIRRNYRKHIAKPENRKKHNATTKAAYWADHTKTLARHAKYRAENAVTVQARRKQWALDNPAKSAEAIRQSHKRNADKRNKKTLQIHHQHREALDDQYIKAMIVQHGTAIKRKDIPQELIEAKRLHLQLYRLIKEKLK